MTPTHTRIERRDDGLAVLTLDKPPANTIEPEMLDHIHHAAASLLADPPGALVVTGVGEFFSGGVDLKVAPNLDGPAQAAMLTSLNRLGALYAFPRPVVTAVNGHAAGAGFVISLFGDYRVASSQGLYGLTEIKAGVSYPVGGIAAVRAELSPPSARKLVLGSELVDAEEALALGAYDEVLPPDEVLPRAIEVAEKMAALPSEVYERSKLALRGLAAAQFEGTLEAGDPLGESWIVDGTPDAARRVLACGDPRR
jgi:enoyl-CoA hydratase